jgi:hypothetical protein
MPKWMGPTPKIPYIEHIAISKSLASTQEKQRVKYIVYFIDVEINIQRDS